MAAVEAVGARATASRPVRATVSRATEEDTPKAQTVAPARTAREDTAATDSSQEDTEALPPPARVEEEEEEEEDTTRATAAVDSLPATTSSRPSLGTASSHLLHPLPAMTVTHHLRAITHLRVVEATAAVEDSLAVTSSHRNTEQVPTASLPATAAPLHRATASRASTDRAPEEDMEMRAPR